MAMCKRAHACLIDLHGSSLCAVSTSYTVGTRYRGLGMSELNVCALTNPPHQSHLLISRGQKLAQPLDQKGLEHPQPALSGVSPFEHHCLKATHIDFAAPHKIRRGLFWACKFDMLLKVCVRCMCEPEPGREDGKRGDFHVCQRQHPVLYGLERE
eukprot:scaffold139187_cov21-Tisochrysis_lutea.AAC.2